ncbi:MAG: hypothetical protein J6P28_01165 [Treponema sp.]|nr:hypothetical protein [Treponema sp.]
MIFTKSKRFVGVMTLMLLFFSGTNLFAASEKRVDWNGRLEGEEEIPAWLRTMRRGNPTAYCQEFGLMQKINREWFIPVGVESYIGWEDGLVAARAQGFMALGQTIATHIESAIGSDLSNGAKSNIQRIAVSSVTDVTGMTFEGYHWYEVEKQVVTGRNKKGKPVTTKQHVWYVYAFYSMDRDTYNTQLKLALQKIVREGGFTKEEATMIASRGLQAMDQQYRRSAEFQQKIAEELQKQRLAWDAQRMKIQQQFVDQQLDSLNRTMSMAEQNQRNQDDLANRNATNNFNQQTMHQTYQNQVDNRNIDTNQQQVQGNTQQLESRDRSNTAMAQANAQSNANQAVANSGAAAGVAGQFGSNSNLPGSDSTPVGPAMNDPLAMLLAM